MHFKEIEHTADIALEVWGENYDLLFIHAAEGFYHLSATGFAGEADSMLRFTLEADTCEDLLVTFLSELNYLLTEKWQKLWPVHFLKISMNKDQFSLECEAEICQLTKESRQALREIKSVTYHKLNITKKADRYHTLIVFDL